MVQALIRLAALPLALSFPPAFVLCLQPRVSCAPTPPLCAQVVLCTCRGWVRAGIRCHFCRGGPRTLPAAPGPAALPALLIAPAVPHGCNGATFHLNLRTSGPRSAALPVQASMVHPQSCETCDSARFSWPGEYRAPLVEGLLRKSDGAPGPLAAVDRERIDFAILALARSLQLAYSPGQVAGQPRFIVLPPVLDTDVNLPANLPLSIVLSPYHLAKVQKELRRRRLSDLPEPVRDHIHIMIPRQPRSSWPESRDSRVAQSQAVDGSCTPTKCLCWCCIDWFRGEDPYRGFVCTCLFFVVFLIVLFVLQVFERHDANDSDSTLSSA